MECVGGDAATVAVAAVDCGLWIVVAVVCAGANHWCCCCCCHCRRCAGGRYSFSSSFGEDLGVGGYGTVVRPPPARVDCPFAIASQLSHPGRNLRLSTPGFCQAVSRAECFIPTPARYCRNP